VARKPSDGVDGQVPSVAQGDAVPAIDLVGAIKTRRILVDPRPAGPHSSLSEPGSADPGRHAAHTAPPTKRASFTMCARGQARCACWLWLLVHRIQAVVVEAKGLPDGEPTAVRCNISGLSGREPHGCPPFRQDPLAVVRMRKVMR